MLTILGVVAAIFAAAYFLPTIVAICRGAKGWGWTFILNLFFGLTGFGYLMAWVWAMGPTHAEQAIAERERLSEEADRAIVIMERRSREALAYHD
jgi:type VI protein secretion system component VasK